MSTTADVRPSPQLLDALTPDFCNRWVPVTEALPPARFSLLVILRGDDTPAYAWLKFAAGDRDCPYFVCPQRAAMKPRGTHINAPEHAKHRDDVTHWYSTGIELPFRPDHHDRLPWGLGGRGWEECQPRQP